MSVEYKDYALVGGQPVKIVPLTVSQPGTYFAPMGMAYSPVIIEGSGSSSLVGTAIVGTATAE